MNTMTDPLLSIKNLTVVFKTRLGEVPVIDDVSFSIAPGEIMGIVGESGLSLIHISEPTRPY